VLLSVRPEHNDKLYTNISSIFQLLHIRAIVNNIILGKRKSIRRVLKGMIQQFKNLLLEKPV